MLTCHYGGSLGSVVNCGALNKGGMGELLKWGVELLTLFPLFNIKSEKMFKGGIFKKLDFS
jgi:hypothetical protein